MGIRAEGGTKFLVRCSYLDLDRAPYALYGVKYIDPVPLPHPFQVRCSYLEIYCEMIRDLLGKDQNKKLDVKETPDSGVYVKDLSTFVAKNSEDMLKIMTKGNENRKVASTAMNATSSRYAPITCPPRQ